MGYKSYLFAEWIKKHIALIVIGSLAVVTTAIVVPVAVSKSKNKESEPTTTQKTVKNTNQYVVTFKNYDGTFLGEVTVNEGDNAVYTGNTPYRPSSVSGNYRYDYTFSGWSDSTDNITYNKTLTAQFSSTSTYVGSSSSSSSSSSSGSGSSYVSDKQKVINHLSSYGSTEYHFVSTGTYSRLGYDSSTGKFIAGWIQDGNLTYTGLYLISFGASSGYGSLSIKSGSTTYFRAYSYVYISNHRYSTMELDSVDVNLFPSSSNSDLASTIINTCQLSVNAATTYLTSHSLPYIY